MPKGRICIETVFKGIVFTNTEYTNRDPWYFKNFTQLPAWLGNLISCSQQIQLSPLSNNQQTTSPSLASLFDHITDSNSDSRTENTIPIPDNALLTPPDLPDITLLTQGEDDSGNRRYVVPTDHSGTTNNSEASNFLMLIPICKQSQCDQIMDLP